MMRATGRLLIISCLLFLPIQDIFAQEPTPDMALVHGGKFKMGSNLGGEDERPVHEVELHDYYIGRYEVTQLEWKMIMVEDTSKRYFEGCDSCPVERVSWHNVQTFLGRLNGMTHKNYRLPTEAEWEYAARGGSLSKGCKYSGSDTEITVAWKVGSSDMTTHPVGRKKPNELGIYDMSGNVFEWCADWYSSAWYQVSPKENPAGPAEGNYRVIRGGSWFFDNAGLRLTDRESANPSFRYGYVGFRLCRSVAEPPQKPATPEKPASRSKDSRDARKNETYKKFIGF
jgi:formylglycine-generating enzyme required for sulfatase activity